MRSFATASSIFLAAILVTGFARTSSADCSSASVLWFCGSDAGVPSLLPAAAATENGVEAWSAGQPCTEGCYDIIKGALEAKGSGNRWSPACGTGAWMNDDYWIVGPPSAQSFSFEAVLAADVTITDGYAATGSIWTDGQYPDFSTIASGPQSVVAALTKLVGEVFALEAHLGTVGGGSADLEGAAHATATLRFRGLPSGYSVASCQGYNLRTPARPSSWGGVKALYR